MTADTITTERIESLLAAILNETVAHIASVNQ